jgi:hypothetical protein
MTRKPLAPEVIRSFAYEARRWQRVGRLQEKAGLTHLSDAAFSMARGIEFAVTVVARRFNRRFDQKGFHAACTRDRSKR